jgi:predicted phage-related endonuclease
MKKYTDFVEEMDKDVDNGTEQLDPGKPDDMSEMYKAFEQIAEITKRMLKQRDDKLKAKEPPKEKEPIARSQADGGGDPFGLDQH